MARQKIIIDLKTGQQSTVPYTAQEETDADAALAAHPTQDQMDTDALNASLLQDGSAFRALGAYVFGLAKGTIPINPNLTQAQFRAALKSLMR